VGGSCRGPPLLLRWLLLAVLPYVCERRGGGGGVSLLTKPEQSPACQAEAQFTATSPLTVTPLSNQRSRGLVERGVFR